MLPTVELWLVGVVHPFPFQSAVCVVRGLFCFCARSAGSVSVTALGLQRAVQMRGKGGKKETLYASFERTSVF